VTDQALVRSHTCPYEICDIKIAFGRDFLRIVKVFYPSVAIHQCLGLEFHSSSIDGIYRGGDKSLVRPGTKKASATEDFDVYLTVHHELTIY